MNTLKIERLREDTREREEKKTDRRRRNRTNRERDKFQQGQT